MTGRTASRTGINGKKSLRRPTHSMAEVVEPEEEQDCAIALVTGTFLISTASPFESMQAITTRKQMQVSHAQRSAWQMLQVKCGRAAWRSVWRSCRSASLQAAPSCGHSGTIGTVQSLYADGVVQQDNGAVGETSAKKASRNIQAWNRWVNSNGGGGGHWPQCFVIYWQTNQPLYKV
jgi:hypothetical protein